MHINRLERQKLIPTGIKECWDFFKDPANLAEITPDEMGFKITSPPHKGKMYPGQIITYKVSPVLGIPINWMTEITSVNAPFSFVDTQLVGPYKVWHHQHHFQETENGTLMTDIVNYSIPLGPLGSIADVLFVKSKLKAIFDYREKKINEKFNIKEREIRQVSLTG